MKIYPFEDICREADQHVRQGRIVFLQFNCAHCGVKQTIDTPNVFHTHGTCEECGGDTDIKKDGGNYMMIASLSN